MADKLSKDLAALAASFKGVASAAKEVVKDVHEAHEEAKVKLAEADTKLAALKEEAKEIQATVTELKKEKTAEAKTKLEDAKKKTKEIEGTIKEMEKNAKVVRQEIEKVAKALTPKNSKA